MRNKFEIVYCFLVVIFRKKLMRSISMPKAIRTKLNVLKSVIPVSRLAIPSRIPPPISRITAVTTGYFANTFRRIPILNFHNLLRLN